MIKFSQKATGFAATLHTQQLTILCLTLSLAACLPDPELDFNDVAGSWQGKLDDQRWCMMLGEDGGANYKAIVREIGQDGIFTGKHLSVDATGHYTLEVGGRLTLEVAFSGIKNRMPFLIAGVSEEKLVYYDGQEPGRNRFVSKRVKSCDNFLDAAE